MYMAEDTVIDQRTINLMKEAGIPKPANVPGQLWNYANTEAADKTRMQVLAYLAACGKKVTDIAEELGMSQPEVSNILSTERMQFEVNSLKYKMFGQDVQKRFKEILPKAVDVAYEVMVDEKAKPALRLSSAINFMDRALGKPTQQVEVGGSLIKELFDRLDGKAVAARPVTEIIIEQSTLAEDVQKELSMPEEVVVDAVREVKEETNPNGRVKLDRDENPNFNPDKWVTENL